MAKMVNLEQESVMLKLHRDELDALKNALLAARLSMDEVELHSRVGLTHDEARRLIDELVTILRKTPG